MKLKVIITFFCFWIATGLSQNNTGSIRYDTCFVKLKNGELHYGTNVIKTGTYWHPKIILDDKTFDAGKVTFYNSVSFYTKDTTLYNDTAKYGKNGFKNEGFLYANSPGWVFLPCVFKYKNLNFYLGVRKRGGFLTTYYYSVDITRLKRLNRINLHKDLIGDIFTVNDFIREVNKFKAY